MNRVKVHLYDKYLAILPPNSYQMIVHRYVLHNRDIYHPKMVLLSNNYLNLLKELDR